jgi:hypothetical protein
MDKTKPDQALSGEPIAKKIVAEMRLHWQRKVVNIKNVIVGHAMAKELQKTVVIQKDLEGLPSPLTPPTSTPRTRCRSCRSSSQPEGDGSFCGYHLEGEGTCMRQARRR